MATMVGFKLVGSACRNGVHDPGWGIIKLDDGREEFVGEKESQGIDSLVDIAEKRGHAVTRMRARLDEWVKTGQMPPH